MEVLSLMINRAKERERIAGFKVSEHGTQISHLQFADGTPILI